MKNYEQINIKQKQSESDPFTKERYRQFYSFFPKQTIKVLDVGCNTGRGGELLKELDKHLILSGLDIVQERLDKLDRKSVV